MVCLVYFFFGVEYKRAGQGGSLGHLDARDHLMRFGTVMGRIALLAGRFEFLFDDWLWLIDRRCILVAFPQTIVRSDVMSSLILLATSSNLRIGEWTCPTISAAGRHRPASRGGIVTADRLTGSIDRLPLVTSSA